MSPLPSVNVGKSEKIVIVGFLWLENKLKNSTQTGSVYKNVFSFPERNESNIQPNAGKEACGGIMPGEQEEPPQWYLNSLGQEIQREKIRLVKFNI